MDPNHPIVELANVHKFYTLGGKRVHVLKGVNMTAGRGEYVALMGSSGSGKSTLLNLLGLLDVIASGEYRLAGDDVGTLGDHDLARRRNANIGFIFQSFNLFPQLDVLGNIEVPMIYGRRPVAQRRKRATALADSGGLGPPP